MQKLLRPITRMAALCLAALGLLGMDLRASAQDSGAPPAADPPVTRVALVIGNAQYVDPLVTAANDAGLVADVLRQAGFDVTGAANLSQDQIRAAFREFLGRAAAAGPQAEIFVYLAGRGLQYEGENYFAPVEATLANAVATPVETVRLSDFLRPLAGLPARGRVVALDLARPNAFAGQGQPLAGGLALIEPEDNALYAFNAAPGAVAAEGQGPYGVYAKALVEMLRQPGLPVADAFAEARLRVATETRGAQTPWSASRLSPNEVLFPAQPAETAAAQPGEAAAPQAQLAVQTRRALLNKPLRDIPADQAYGAVLQRDTIEGYQEFLTLYPNDPQARRVRAMAAARREALLWRRTVNRNTSNAYWTYLKLYPRGPHGADARRRLALLQAALEPPVQFDDVIYDDLPPPPPEEVIFVERPIFAVDDFVDAPPPILPLGLLPPPVDIVDLAPPPPVEYGFALPVPPEMPVRFPYSRPIGGLGAAGVAAGALAVGGLSALAISRPGRIKPPSGLPVGVTGVAPGGRPITGVRPIGAMQPGVSQPIGQAPIGQAPVGQAPIGQAPVGQAPVAVQPGARPVASPSPTGLPPGVAPGAVGQRPIGLPPGVRPGAGSSPVGQSTTPATPVAGRPTALPTPGMGGLPPAPASGAVRPVTPGQPAPVVSPPISAPNVARPAGARPTALPTPGTGVMPPVAAPNVVRPAGSPPGLTARPLAQPGQRPVAPVQPPVAAQPNVVRPVAQPPVVGAPAGARAPQPAAQQQLQQQQRAIQQQQLQQQQRAIQQQQLQQQRALQQQQQQRAAAQAAQAAQQRAAQAAQQRAAQAAQQRAAQAAQQRAAQAAQQRAAQAAQQRAMQMQMQQRAAQQAAAQRAAAQAAQQRAIQARQPRRCPPGVRC